MAIALLLTVTLFLGLVGIGALVFYRFFAGPVEVAMPTPVGIPTDVPVDLATSTPVLVPSATPTPLATATLVVSSATETAIAEVVESDSEQDGSGTASTDQESAEMPETGLGSLEIVGAGLVLACLLGGAGVARRMRADGRP